MSVQMAVSPHRRAEDHAGAFGVERPFRVSVVLEGFCCSGHRPLLSIVHFRRDSGRDAEAFPIKSESPHPAADGAVGLVGGAAIGVEVVLDEPSVGRNFTDAVSTLTDVAPESRRVRGIGEHRSNAHDGDRDLSTLSAHGPLLRRTRAHAAGKTFVSLSAIRFMSATSPPCARTISARPSPLVRSISA